MDYIKSLDVNTNDINVLNHNYKLVTIEYIKFKMYKLCDNYSYDEDYMSELCIIMYNLKQKIKMNK